MAAIAAATIILLIVLLISYAQHARMRTKANSTQETLQTILHDVDTGIRKSPLLKCSCANRRLCQRPPTYFGVPLELGGHVLAVKDDLVGSGDKRRGTFRL